MPEKITPYYYYVLNKPYGYLSQFSGEVNDLLLGSLYPFPKDVYSVGRLDKDSEGLLLLTNDNKLKNSVLSPDNHYIKTYWVQVDGAISTEAIETLQSGTIVIKHSGKPYRVKKATSKLLDSVVTIQERNPPIRYRANIPTSWIEIQLTEGKNRQVRKMTAAVGFPTLRLIRVGIGKMRINELKQGEVKELSASEIQGFLSK
jgi:23S rRNA pseudouridine2457 synthase